MGNAFNSSTDMPGRENRPQADVGGDAGKEKQTTGCKTPEFTPPPMPPIKPAREPATVAGANCPKCGQPLKEEYGTLYCYKCLLIVDPLLLRQQDKEV